MAYSGSFTCFARALCGARLAVCRRPVGRRKFTFTQWWRHAGRLLYCHRPRFCRHFKPRQAGLCGAYWYAHLYYSNLGRIPRRYRICSPYSQYVRAGDRLLHTAESLWPRRESAMIFSSMKRNGIILAAFAAVATALLITVQWATADRIAAQQRNEVMRTLNELVPLSTYSNDLY